VLRQIRRRIEQPHGWHRSDLLDLLELLDAVVNEHRPDVPYRGEAPTFCFSCGEPLRFCKTRAVLDATAARLPRSSSHQGGDDQVDLIEIDKLRLRCVIGTSETERRDRQDVVIDLRVGTDVRPAATSDELADVWNYRTPTKAVISAVEGSAYQTVEALADRLARLLVLDHHAPYARVRVCKPGALRFADSVGLVIERTPADYAAVAGEGERHAHR
jgi:FolB domain-containing protein